MLITKWGLYKEIETRWIVDTDKWGAGRQAGLRAAADRLCLHTHTGSSRTHGTCVEG